ncbi:TetR/AcrR family transcriptional regulator [Agrobacterium tumefaciens]|uniref:TetR/AcrR family transcriptional regulator n=1 Tax=Agrobacterium tumefaciens TaxID=358 RepID=A0AA44F4C7_AGRTU|nr:TetR/AcrR family transcriptional regulator [Agrobacterium tumefaciens]NSL21328.1 TetR/AcrR family transcriptional regulator [Agrobacterium tumefaciens]NTB83900.1 TetR/AcrR family transcriptional regulator [Agrobacterium tumefaciens]NTC20631.1 TetR/AcrR family transcriptional regulator [Agrobacterium tumefaciens]NTC29371.1 TetR/AcrR family transcriptional regulator [Agrobacterium tumefaciens]NTC57867.1 TetR/AcrR family transcriptional regulator [Agrobacterium tumefaciens]
MRGTVRDEILEVAGALFYAEGIRAVGVERIISHANVAKATLYRHFPAKEDLVVAYLLERHTRVLKMMHIAIDQAEHPRGQIDAMFMDLFRKSDSPDYRGCAFMLAVAEHGDVERVVLTARAHKQAVRDIFAAILSQTRSTEGFDPIYFAILYEGALASYAIDCNCAAILKARDCALHLFDSMVSRKSPPGNKQTT